MSCCGKQRANWQTQSSRTSQTQTLNSQFVYFRYAGTDTITVRGAVSGRAYRFSGPGATLAIDPRDAPAIAGVPLMQRVSNF